ncbi:hypothetical protein RJ640_001534, partial [Escallonia rubra]
NGYKSLARSTIKNITGEFDDINGYKSTLQELGSIEFNLVQTVHHQELVQVSRWWKHLGLAKELKLAREHPLKWHMWPMAALTDPSLSEQRVDLTKPISLIYLIDDIFDVYGILDELTLFTEAVNRNPVVLVHMFFLLGDGATNESANLVNDNPGIITSIATLLRLWDDLGSAEDEEQDGHDGSYIKYYMQEHERTSIEGTRQHITKMISETWKRLKKECLSESIFGDFHKVFSQYCKNNSYDVWLR